MRDTMVGYGRIMATSPSSKFWQRRDVPGVEHALVDARNGLRARGTQVAVDPIAYTCTYELQTDAEWMTTFLEVRTEGAGWVRTLRLEPMAERWRATTSEQGNLDAVLAAAGRRRESLPGIEDPNLLLGASDVDLAGSALFNTLPIRRLRVLDAEPGVEQRIKVVRVLLPTLEVIAAEQVYTFLKEGVVQLTAEGFNGDLIVDDDGFVAEYRELARLIR